MMAILGRQVEVVDQATQFSHLLRVRHIRFQSLVATVSLPMDDAECSQEETSDHVNFTCCVQPSACKTQRSAFGCPRKNRWVILREFYTLKAPLFRGMVIIIKLCRVRAITTRYEYFRASKVQIGLANGEHSWPYIFPMA